MPKLVCVLLACGIVAAASPAVSLAALLSVPSQYPTIQAGLDAAAFGDTVLVSPGDYTDFEERIIAGTPINSAAFLRDGVMLRSESGPSVTTIDMLGLGNAFSEVAFAYNLPSSGTAIEGFTITGGPPGSSGLWANFCGKVTVRDCVFRDLSNQNASGGITANSSVNLDVYDSRFENCQSAGGGAIWHGDGVLVISGCEFRNCSQRAVDVTGQQGGILEQATITGCTFIGNTSTGGAGALHLADVTGGVVVTDCWFEGNVDGGSGGGALSIAGSTPGTIQGNVFLFNDTPVGQGGMIRVSSATRVEGNTFYGGSAGTSGSAVAFVSGANGSQLLNNIIAASTTTEAVFVFNATVTTGCNIFWQNAAGNGDGYTPGPTDREVDPLFCDVSSEDFTVAQDSPALPACSNGCGQIGALGQGCGPVSVEARSWGSIKSGYR